MKLEQQTTRHFHYKPEVHSALYKKIFVHNEMMIVTLALDVRMYDERVRATRKEGYNIPITWAK